MKHKLKYLAVSALFLGLFLPSTTYAAGLTPTQIEAVLNLLVAFNVDTTTLENVKVALNAPEVKPVDIGAVQAPKPVVDIEIPTTKKLFTGNPEKLCKGPRAGYQWGKATGDSCKIWLAEQI